MAQGHVRGHRLREKCVPPFLGRLPAALDSGIEEVERKDKKHSKKITSKDIPDIYPVGSEVLVQVTKGPISTKGAAHHHKYIAGRSFPRPDAV
jgi:hypothetical protein